ncbi:hypothetical protein [Flavobacterium sp. JP2137]|uniref:hypothetical protein n=1 Tax=Flavobacterium sp. JP2137 TaxID=3414510 RepID=UPI003D2FFA38
MNIESYKAVINKSFLFFCFFVIILFVVFDYLNILNFRVVSYLVSFILLWYLIPPFFGKVYEVLIVNEEEIIIKKRFLFKVVYEKFNIKNLAFKYKERISYPNKFYELILIIDNREILVNTKGDLVSFMEEDENKILLRLKELNIKEMF